MDWSTNIIRQLRQRETGCSLFGGIPGQLNNKPGPKPKEFIQIPLLDDSKRKHDCLRSGYPSPAMLSLFGSEANISHPVVPALFPPMDTQAVINNRTFLELYLNAEDLTKCKEYGCSALELFYSWLCACGVVDEKVKSQLSVNKKIRNIQAQYKTKRATFNSRLDPVRCRELQQFMEETVVWHPDNKLPKKSVQESAQLQAKVTTSVLSLPRHSPFQRPSPQKHQLMEENRRLKRKVGVMDHCRVAAEQRVAELEVLVDKDVTNIQAEMQVVTKMNDKVRDDNQQLRKKLKCSVSRDVHDKVVRTLKTEFSGQKSTIVQLHQEIATLESEVESLREKGLTVVKDKRNMRKKLQRRDTTIIGLSRKLQDVTENFRTDKESAALLHNSIVRQLEDEVERGERSQRQLQEEILSLQNLETQRGGIYLPHVRLMYYSLLTKGVSANTITDVVKTVLEHTTGIDIENTALPSRATAQRMVTEAGQLVKIRTSYELARNGGELGHHSDGTTKSMIHWGTHLIKLEVDGATRAFTLCVSPVPTGRASDTVSQLQTQLTELKELAVKMDVQHTEETYSISRIASRMSDRANTEKSVSAKLMAEKEKMLQESEDWDNLTTAEQEQRKKICTFTCASHKINNTANEMTQAAAKHLYGAASHGRNLRGASKHVYEVNKLICTRSKKEYADGVDFKMFCLSQEDKPDLYSSTACDMMLPIVGNRYIVYLLNSVPVLLGKDAILIYLEHLREQKALNRLEDSVLQGYLCENIMAELTAYAVSFFFVCYPLLNKAKSCSSPLHMNQYYQTAVIKLGEFSEDASGLLAGDSTLWRSMEDMQADPFYKHVDLVLRIAQETVDTVKPILEVMAAAGRKKLKEHASEHLVGGIYSNPTPQDVSAANLLGTATNDCVESCFGTLDREQSNCPMRNPVNTSALVAAKKDKPQDFIRNVSAEKQEDFIRLARTSARKLKTEKGTTRSSCCFVTRTTGRERNKSVKIDYPNVKTKRKRSSKNCKPASL